MLLLLYQPTTTAIPTTTAHEALEKEVGKFMPYEVMEKEVGEFMPVEALGKEVGEFMPVEAY